MIRIDGHEYLVQCDRCQAAVLDAPLFDPFADGVPVDMDEWPKRCGNYESVRCDCCGRWVNPVERESA